MLKIFSLGHTYWISNHAYNHIYKNIVKRETTWVQPLIAAIDHNQIRITEPRISSYEPLIRATLNIILDLWIVNGLQQNCVPKGGWIEPWNNCLITNQKQGRMATKIQRSSQSQKRKNIP